MVESGIEKKMVDVFKLRPRFAEVGANLEPS